MRAPYEDVTLKRSPGVGHFRRFLAMSRPLRNDAPTLDDILDFIHRHRLADAQQAALR